MLNIYHYIWIIFGPPLSIYLMILISGDTSWYYGNFFLYITTLSIYCISLYLFIYNKGLLVERFRFKSKDQDLNDKPFISNIGRCLFVLFYIIIPLEHRYTLCSSFNGMIYTFSSIMIFLSYLIIFFTFKQNSYASPIIRNQKERNHTIITSGLYSIVRHPMYTACVLIFIFTPLMLNSLLGLFFGIFISYMFCKRINIEEEFLNKEFATYEEYQNKVKYKILPFIY